MMPKKKAIIVLVIIFTVIIGLILLAKYIARNPNPISKDLKNQKNYSIVYIHADAGNISIEDYLIVNNDKKVIDTREILIGYNSDELNQKYNSYNTSSPVYYNVQIRENRLIYSTTIYNGRSSDDIVKLYKENSNYSNVKVNEI